MVIHILTPQGEQMVVQVVDGNVIVPQAAPAAPSPSILSVHVAGAQNLFALRDPQPLKHARL